MSDTVVSGNLQSELREKVKWYEKVRSGFRDTILLAFGLWIIWTQVYAKNPNGYLILVGFGFVVPSARAAIISVLSAPGSSSSQEQQRGRHRRSSEDTDNESD